MNSEVKPSFNRKSRWNQGRTQAERRLILITIIFALIALSLIIALIVVCNQKHVDDEDVCTTPGCIHAASTVLKYMDSTVDPCDDFYDFSCGTYLQDTTIPEDKASISTFSIISDQVREQLKLIIEQPAKSEDIRPYKLIKKFYDLCMNTTAIESDGLNTVKMLLKDLGGWPVLDGDSWNEGRFDWKQSVYTFRKRGFSDSYFIGYYIGLDDKNTTRRLVILDEASLGLAREFIIKGFDERLVKGYYDFMVDVAVLFGANKERALKELKESLEFEIQLANLCLPKEERRNSTALYNPMTVEELQHRYPSINWIEYLNNILHISDIKITYDETVIVSVPKFISDLEELLRKTPKRIQANYVMTKAVMSKIFFLNKELRDRQFEYYKIISGQSERPARWKECIGVATGKVFYAVSSLYVRKYFNEVAKEHAEEMVKDIRKQFEKILHDIDWMDPETKKNALDKAYSITPYIGYASELLDDKNIEKYYAKLEEPTDNYLKTSISASLFETEIAYRKLREPVNKTDWREHSFPTVVNAFYSSSENSIEFPAAILQGIFYSDDRPWYMNYGAIGYVIGHEITHGFDDEGRQFDKDGNLNNWWAEETKIAFMEKAQCIIDQYGNYTVVEVDTNINGINTQGENIADSGGIKEAYLAYQDWVSRHQPEKQLPGLNYNPNQLFWIAAAQTWCAKYRPEILKIQVIAGVHSPGRYRVIGPFGNTEEFGKDFNCPVGSKMNPEKKCRVW